MEVRFSKWFLSALVGGKFSLVHSKASESQLKEKQKEIKEIIDVGVKNDFITPSDQKAMQPNGVEGRL